MKRLWPQSLFGRLVLILLAGLVAAHGLSFALLVYQRVETARAVMSYYVGRDIASSVAILERIPAAERGAWLEKLERANYRYVLGTAPRGEPLPPGPAQEVAAAVRQALGERYAVSASTPVPKRINLQLTLADGAPLTVQLRPSGMSMPAELPLILAAQLLILAGFTWFAVRLATRPLAQLAQAADALGPGMQVQALPESGPLEVVRAATAFNAMQERIAGHLAERMRILAAVSHDLQTPITRMRLRADLLDDAAQRDKMLADLHAMQMLVEEGIVYASSAHGLREAPCRTDLDALLASLVYDYLDAGHAVRLAGQLGHPLTTHPHALRRIVGNLVENALKFGDEVEIVVAAQGDERVSIAVRDRGPGLEAAELASVFEPFYRVENSRNRDTGGTGLGLAIVRQLATAMGGSVSLANREGGGLEARLVLPATA